MIKILKISIAFLVISLSSCVLRSNAKLAYENGFSDGKSQATIKRDKFCEDLQNEKNNLISVQNQRINSLQREIDMKNVRLKKFNQIDSSNNLYPMNPCFNHPNSADCKEKITGKESWQK